MDTLTFIKSLETLTFNASDSSGDVVTATATVTSRGDRHCGHWIRFKVIYRGEQFEAYQSEQIYAGVRLPEVCELSCDGEIIARAVDCRNDGDWVASRNGRVDDDLTRKDRNPIVALLQVASNIM